MAPHFSQRSAVEPAPQPLLVALDARRALGLPVWDLTCSNPSVLQLPYAGQALSAALAQPDVHAYAPHSLGDERARQALSQLWQGRGVAVPHEHIALTASTSEAYAVLFKLLCDPGTEVLVPEPSYPLLAELARYEGVKLVPYTLAYAGAWYIDHNSVQSLCTPLTRAIICVSPNNPTGSWLEPSDVQRLLRLGLPLISDEVFWAYPHSETSAGAPSALLALRDWPEFEPALVFALDGLSKFAAMPGMKLAWLTLAGAALCVQQALERLEFILDAYLSVNTPVQRALPQLLEASAVTRSALRQRIADNLKCLDALVAGSAVTRLAAQGGWNAVLRLPSTQSEEQWAQALLREQGVLVQPGYLYDFMQEPYCVLSLITPPAVFAEGAQRLVHYVERTA